MGIARGWEKWVIQTNITYAKRTVRIFSVSPQSHSLFSASFQTFCLTRSRFLEYAKIRTVLQSTRSTACFTNRKRVVQERARRRIQTSSRIIVPCRRLTLIITFLTFLTCGVSLHVVSKNGLVPAPFFSQNTNFHYKKGIYKELALFSCLCPFAFVFFSPQTQSKWHMLTAYCFRRNSKHTQRETLRIRGSTGN